MQARVRLALGHSIPGPTVIKQLTLQFFALLLCALVVLAHTCRAVAYTPSADR